MVEILGKSVIKFGDPLTLNGDSELSIAIEWIKWRHFNGANGRQWRSPLSPMDVAIGATDRIAIGDNGASNGATYCRHWRQWRQMIHSPNYLTLLPNFDHMTMTPGRRPNGQKVKKSQSPYPRPPNFTTLPLAWHDNVDPSRAI